MSHLTSNSDALKKDGVANVLSSIEDDKKGADIIPVKNDENKSKPAKANQVNKTHKIKEEYYQKAKCMKVSDRVATYNPCTCGSESV